MCSSLMRRPEGRAGAAWLLPFLAQTRGCLSPPPPRPPPLAEEPSRPAQAPIPGVSRGYRGQNCWASLLGWSLLHPFLPMPGGPHVSPGQLQHAQGRFSWKQGNISPLSPATGGHLLLIFRTMQPLQAEDAPRVSVPAPLGHSTFSTFISCCRKFPRYFLYPLQRPTGVSSFHPRWDGLKAGQWESCRMGCKGRLCINQQILANFSTDLSTPLALPPRSSD